VELYFTFYNHPTIRCSIFRAIDNLPLRTRGIPPFKHHLFSGFTASGNLPRGDMASEQTCSNGKLTSRGRRDTRRRSLTGCSAAVCVCVYCLLAMCWYESGAYC